MTGAEACLHILQPLPYFPIYITWAENYDCVSNLCLRIHVHVLPLSLPLNSEKRARMRSLLLHMSATRPVRFWLRHKCFKGMSTSLWGSKGLHIRDPLCAKGSVPLNPAALMCHIVAPFSSFIPTLSLRPMEVISRALFLLDQRVGGHHDLPCLMRNPLRGSLEMTGVGLGYTASTVGVSCATRVKTMMNDGATMVSLKIWDVQHGQSCWFSVNCKDCSRTAETVLGSLGILVFFFFQHSCAHTATKQNKKQLTHYYETLCPWICSSQVFQFPPSPPAFSTPPHLLLRSQLEEN